MALRPTSEASSMLIRLFGPFEVLLNGQPLDRLRFRKSQSVLALLALRSPAGGYPGPVERRWLAGLLWPDSLDGQMLRNCLSNLRRALGPEAGRLRSPTPQTLALDLSRATVDVLAFDAAIARGDPASLAEAVALRRGPLLEGCSEEWAFEERQRREPLFLAALEKLARLALEHGELDAAEQHLQRAIATDPLRESAHRGLMQALAAGGNRSAALLVYRELRLRLHRELNSEPDPETTRLFQRLRNEARQGARDFELGGQQFRSAKATKGHEENPSQAGAFSPQSSSCSFPGTGPRPCRSAAKQASPAFVDQPQIQYPIGRGRIVGREREVAELQRCLEAMLNGEGATVLLAGEPGIGKTRLATEAARWAGQRGFRVLGGRCDEAGGPPYQPWAEAIREYLATAEPARVAKALSPGITAALVRILPEIAAKVQGVPPSPPLPAEAAHHALTEAVRQLFASLPTPDTPVLLFLDDLHWADAGSLALLRTLARAAPRLPLLILGTYRDLEPDLQPLLEETVAVLHRERLSRRLSLRRLSAAAVAEMVTALLAEPFEQEHAHAQEATGEEGEPAAGKARPRPPVTRAPARAPTPARAPEHSDPAPLVAALHQQTEGNPFFVEEMLQHLVEEGALGWDGERWQIRLPEPLGVPQSVQMTIERRLRRLSAESRETLTLAAVIGQQFTFDLLLQASGMEEERLLAIIEAWLAAHLVVELPDRAVNPGPQIPNPKSQIPNELAERYQFQHALIREVAYAAPSRRRKARLHERVGQALETVSASSPEEHLEELAHHAAQAYRGRAPAGPAVEKGVDYCLRAGERALHLWANEAAIQHLTAALALLDGLPEDEPHLRKRWEVVFRLFEVYVSCQALERAEPVLRDYLALSERAGYPAGIAAAHRWLARALALSHEAAGCLYSERSFRLRMEHLERSLRVAEQHGLADWRARTRWAIANCVPTSMNDLPRAEALLRATLQHPESLPVEEVRETCGKLMEICALQGKWEAMLAVLRQSLPSGGPSDLFRSLGIMDEALDREGKQAEYIAFCSTARALLDQAGCDPLDAWYLQPARPSEAFRPLLFRDSFDAPELHPEWQWHDPHPTAAGALASGYNLSEKPGCLTLRAGPTDDLHGNRNAPRLLREMRGDFALEVRMAGDWDAQEESYASSGLLVWKDLLNFVRLEKYSMHPYHRGSIRLEATINGEYRIVGRGLLRGSTYSLRLERIGQRLRALCSTDGAQWLTCGQLAFPAQDPLLIGVASLHGMVAHFDSVQVLGRGDLPPG